MVRLEPATFQTQISYSTDWALFVYLIFTLFVIFKDMVKIIHFISKKVNKKKQPVNIIQRSKTLNQNNEHS